MRKSIIATQLTIAVLCIWGILSWHMALLPVLVFLLITELGALAGIWWGRRLRAKAETAPLF